MSAREIIPLFRITFTEWTADKAPRLAAALAYYSVFSLSPLLVIVIAAAGLIFGEEAAQGRIVNEIKGTVGQPVAQAVEQLLANASDPGWGTGAALIGLFTLLFGASGVFGQLQDALNTIWKVAHKPGRGIWRMIQDRFLSLTMVLGTGFLLLVSLVISATLAALSRSMSGLLPGGVIFWQLISNLVSFGVITLLFAMIYRFLPDASVAWRDVWIGAALTAFLFTLGKYLLGWYLGRASVTSAYGAAASLVIILIWVYYSSAILLFGAEFTRVHAQRFGSGVKPKLDAVALTNEMLDRQGIRRVSDARSTQRTSPPKNLSFRRP